MFVIEGGQAHQRPARLGLVGYEHVEVLDGLHAGQEVILSDMSDYLHLDALKIDE